MKLLQDLKDLPRLRQELADAKTKLEGIPQIESALEAALLENKDFTAKLAETQGKLTVLEGEKTKLAADFAAYQADEGKRNAAYAAANIGAHAVKPIKTEPKGTEMEKKDLSKLTGLERAIAANALLHESKQ